MMWIQAAALLLACCLWPAEAQRDGSRRQSIWDNPIKFPTKDKDLCTMIITGQGEHTRLRLSCQADKRSYWCDYVGKPHTCSAYNKNPRHYFVQMMWTLRKLPNACEGPKQFQPHMCRKATGDSQMIFSSASDSLSRPEAASRKTAARQAKQPGGPQTRPAPARPGSARQASMKGIREPQRVKTTPSPIPQPTTPPAERYAKKVARQYCWRSLQRICSFTIGLFRN